MKSACKLIVVVLAFLALPANAQSAREQLKQMVGQLQKSPSDSALREKIIKLGANIKPAPAVPEEAVRHMARGSAAFKGATSPADFQEAAKEFELAVLAAPWSSDAYFNLGVAQDKAGNYAAALNSLKLALLAAPGGSGIKELIYEVEYRRDKALTAPRAPDLARLQGTWVHNDGPTIWFYQVQMSGDTVNMSVARYQFEGRIDAPVPGRNAEFRLRAEGEALKGVYVEGYPPACRGLESPARATVSADGREMTVVTVRQYHISPDAKSCERHVWPEWRVVMRKE